MRQKWHYRCIGACDHEDRNITSDPICQQRQEQVAGSDKNETSKRVANALFRVIGVQAVGDDDDETEHVWRHGEELCNVSREAQVCDDGRAEVRETVEAVDHEEVGQRIQPEHRIEQCRLCDFNIESLILFVWCERAHTSHGEDTLLCGQEFGVTWVIGHEDPDDDSEQNRRNSGENEKPLPACKICFAVQEGDSGVFVSALFQTSHESLVTTYPLARRPLKAPATATDPAKMAKRVARSDGLYQ